MSEHRSLRPTSRSLSQPSMRKALLPGTLSFCFSSRLLSGPLMFSYSTSIPSFCVRILFWIWTKPGSSNLTQRVGCVSPREALGGAWHLRRQQCHTAMSRKPWAPNVVKPLFFLLGLFLPFLSFTDHVNFPYECKHGWVKGKEAILQKCVLKKLITCTSNLYTLDSCFTFISILWFIESKKLDFTMGSLSLIRCSFRVQDFRKKLAIWNSKENFAEDLLQCWLWDALVIGCSHSVQYPHWHRCLNFHGFSRKHRDLILGFSTKAAFTAGWSVTEASHCLDFIWKGGSMCWSVCWYMTLPKSKSGVPCYNVKDLGCVILGRWLWLMRPQKCHQLYFQWSSLSILITQIKLKHTVFFLCII